MPWYPRVTDERLRRLCGGRPAVVTGAGSGMGRELAHRLSAAGVRVLVSDIDDAALGETVTSSPGGGAPLVAAVLDVADADAVAAYVHDVVGREGPPALVLNNAGITMVAGVHEEDDRHARRIMAVNFGGVVNGTTAFLPHLEAAGGGHIVNTSSAFGLLGALGAIGLLGVEVRGSRLLGVGSETVAGQRFTGKHPHRVSGRGAHRDSAARPVCRSCGPRLRDPRLRPSAARHPPEGRCGGDPLGRRRRTRPDSRGAGRPRPRHRCASVRGGTPAATRHDHRTGVPADDRGVTSLIDRATATGRWATAGWPAPPVPRRCG